MLDINIIRKNPDLIIKDLEKRRDTEKLKLFKEVQKLDIQYRKEKYALQELKASKNKISQEINKLKKDGKDIKEKIKELKDLPKKVEQLQKKVEEIQEELREYLMQLPNITHESVPYGEDESGNKVIRKWGKKPKKSFELKNHAELTEELGVADFDRATKIAGAGFYFLKGKLALLHRALMNFAIDELTKKGYSLTEPPQMMRRKPYEGVTDLTDFENVMFKIEGQDRYLIATSEHPLTAMYMNEVIDDEELPIKMMGLSINFRKEIGAHGIDQKGLYRRHQFWKVEQVIICKPKDSWRFHEELIRNAEEIIQKLELPYHIVNICTGELGIVAAKKFDLEAWMPRQEKYGELVSCSNCTDWQARRLNIRYGKQGGDKKLVHTLNATGIVTRALVAIIENNQNKDGSISIPLVLQPYMNGVTQIRPK